MSTNVIEHGSGRMARWLRERRVRMAAWIALVEGVLVIFHAIPRWPALGVAVAIVAGYLWAGRNARQPSVRQAGWILAASQALVLLIPVFALLFWTVAVVAVVILGAIALFVLFSQRN
ncbi:MAG TPA: hypothetical protein VFI37_03430 [Gaiellaceae bacterium]|jgi:hypothetical protein|nr:hypothetical protein [Gaiellaceae bacterium]